MLAEPLKGLEAFNDRIWEGNPSRVIVLFSSSYIALSDSRIKSPVFKDTFSKNIILLSSADIDIDTASTSILSLNGFAFKQKPINKN